ncbi:hypothetical protein ACFLVN_01940 [Chloroflexota bacterium]
MFQHIEHNSHHKSNSNKVIWGLRIDRRVKKSCQYFAGLMGVSVSNLVSFIIAVWLNNATRSFKEQDNLRRLATIVGVYGSELDNKPAPTKKWPRRDEDTITYPTTNWTIRQVSAQTRLTLRLLALNRGIPVAKVIDDLAAQELERAEKRKEVVVPGMSAKLKREVHKLLHMPLQQDYLLVKLWPGMTRFFFWGC